MPYVFLSFCLPELPSTGRPFWLADLGWGYDDANDVGARPAGECTCERATSENQPVSGEACPCGKRGAGEFDLLNHKSGSILEEVNADARL